jgi:hypothetical protein
VSLRRRVLERAQEAALEQAEAGVPATRARLRGEAGVEALTRARQRALEG